MELNVTKILEKIGCCFVESSILQLPFIEDSCYVNKGNAAGETLFLQLSNLTDFVGVLTAICNLSKKKRLEEIFNISAEELRAIFQYFCEYEWFGRQNPILQKKTHQR